MRKLIAGVALFGVLATGCTGAINPTQRDLEGLRPEEPDVSRVFLNADQFPNINILCVDGVGFVTAGTATGSPRELSQQAYDKLCKEAR